MARIRVAAALGAVLTLHGCISSSIVLYVRPDKTGRAVITTRLDLAGMRAFDAMFPGEAPKRPPQVEEEMPPPGQGELESAFGARVRLVSTKLDKLVDGGVRTTTVEFDDVTALQMMFPPLALTGGLHMGFSGMGVEGVSEPTLMTFAVKPHDNGDRLLVLKLPNARVSSRPDDPMTVFKSDSPEEQLFKRVIKGMSLSFAVELEQPLLRTNAPKQDGNRATILDLDLDRMINAMDENRVRRMMSPGSFQEILWQVGDLPGAVVPTETEIFLEYEGPPQQPPRPAPAAASAQPPTETEIFLAPLKTANGAIAVGAPVNITNSPAYDNQPFFTPDGKSILFTSSRDAAPGDTALTRTDIYRYDIASRETARVTQTPEGEYSPTVMPDGSRVSVIRVEADGTQRLASILPSGSKIQVDILVPEIKPVGYHAWADDHTLALFVLGGGGAPSTLQLADTRTGAARVIATDIGRSLQPIPGSGVTRHISFVQRERAGDKTTLTIKELDPASGAVTTLTPAVEGAAEADLAWTPDGTLLMAGSDVLYAWRRGQSGWKEIGSLQQQSLHGVTRLAVSPKGDYLAIVAAAR